MQGGGHGHSQSGTRGNKKIGFSGTKGAKASDNQESTKGGKAAKSATEYKCHNSGKSGY